MEFSERTGAADENLPQLPGLSACTGQIVVIKYGGNAMLSEDLKEAVLRDVVLLKEYGLKPVLAHGGGPGINAMLKKMDIPVKFIRGLRYTSAEILEVVEAVLIGQVNTELVSLLQKYGGRAAGLSGVSGDIFHCRLQDEELGLVGEIERVDASAIRALLDADFIPVIAPLGTDLAGTVFNINGDTAAGKLASALGAAKLLLLTDIEGLCNSVEKRDVISYLNIADVPMLKERGTITGGMIPKVDCCVDAIREGVGSVHILDGRQPHSILKAFQEEAFGTTIGTAHASVGIK